MKLTKKIFSLFLGTVLLVTSIPKGLAMNHNEEAIPTENSSKETSTIIENTDENEDDRIATEKSNTEGNSNEQDEEMDDKKTFSIDEDIDEDEANTSIEEDSNEQNEDNEMSDNEKEVSSKENSSDNVQEKSSYINSNKDNEFYKVSVKPCGTDSDFKLKKENIAVIAYSKEIRDQVFNSISTDGGSIVGKSPVDGKCYKINFVKLPPYPAYCNDDELKRYISDNKSKITKCCGCVFIYDLSEVYDSYNGPLLKPWEMRENGYGNEVKEKCRRWCHAIEAVNPERFFLFIPNKENLHNSADKDFWGGYACDDICNYCEQSWLRKYPSHGQFVGAIPSLQRTTV